MAEKEPKIDPEDSDSDLEFSDAIDTDLGLRDELSDVKRPSGQESIYEISTE
jgi:hypothetical protein